MPVFVAISSSVVSSAFFRTSISLTASSSPNACATLVRVASSMFDNIVVSLLLLLKTGLYITYTALVEFKSLYEENTKSDVISLLLSFSPFVEGRFSLWHSPMIPIALYPRKNGQGKQQDSHIQNEVDSQSQH